MPPYFVPYAPQNIFVPNGRLVDLIRAQGEDAARAAQQRGALAAQMWGNVGNAIQSGIGNVIQAQQLGPRLELEKARAATAMGAVQDRAALDRAFQAPQPFVGPMPEGQQAPGPPSLLDQRQQILDSVPGHLRAVVQKQFEDDDARTTNVQKAQDALAEANHAKVSGLLLSIKQHDYDPTVTSLALQSAQRSYQNDPTMMGQISRFSAMLGNNPSRETVQRLADSIPLTEKDQKTWQGQVQASRKGLSDAGLATLNHLGSEKGTPLTARDVLTNRIAQGMSDGTILPGQGQQALMTAAGAGPAQLPQILDQFVSPEDRAAWEQKKALTAKDLAEAAKAQAEAAAGPKRSEQEQALDAYAKSIGKTNAGQLTDADRQAFVKRDAQNKATMAFQQHVQERQYDVAHPVPVKGKSQDELEQEGRGVLQREFSSRSGGLGLEDQKVNQAIHLLTLMDQFEGKPMPDQIHGELALGLAKLTSPNGQVGIELEREFKQKTAEAGISKAVAYLTGDPTLVNATPDKLRTMLRDSITRQGNVAEQNRQTYLNAMVSMLPTQLEPARREAISAGTKLNIMPAPKGSPSDGTQRNGATWKHGAQGWGWYR